MADKAPTGAPQAPEAKRGADDKHDDKHQSAEDKKAAAEKAALKERLNKNWHHDDNTDLYRNTKAFSYRNADFQHVDVPDNIWRNEDEALEIERHRPVPPA